ncbi:MAG: twin-arginine translocase TatA/TatE family subunit [Anaerolineales bacterium]|nr:twin-arginine translocase TatA/TatE family subunit [Anaerolineales bacterium]
MEILGIGPLELLFIIIIALIVLGPKDMVKAGRTLGRTMRKVVTSPAWRSFIQASKDLSHLPNKLMREAGLEEEIQQIKEMDQEIRGISRDPQLSITNDVREQIDQAKAEFPDWTGEAIIIDSPELEVSQPASDSPGLLSPEEKPNPEIQE